MPSCATGFPLWPWSSHLNYKILQQFGSTFKSDVSASEFTGVSLEISGFVILNSIPSQTEPIAMGI